MKQKRHSEMNPILPWRQMVYLLPVVAAAQCGLVTGCGVPLTSLSKSEPQHFQATQSAGDISASRSQAVYPGEYSDEEATLLLIHFNKELNADMSREAPYLLRGHGALTKGGQGKFGEALIVERGMTVSPAGCWAPFHALRYTAGNNLNSAQGTLEFWVRFARPPSVSGQHSENPGDDTQERRVFVVAVNRWADGRQNDASLHFRFRADMAMVEYYEGRNYRKDLKSDIFHLSTPMMGRPEQWTHLALTWEGKDRALFLDGKCVSKGQVPWPDVRFVPEATEIAVGNFTAEYNPKLDSEVEFHIDEFRISDVSRYSSASQEK